MREDFACFILTHGRADNVKTEKTLRACGYTGKVFYVIDDEDEQGDQYRARFGAERVFEFCKAEEMRKCDQGNNWDIRGVILYARNACWEIAKRAGVKYFTQLDDD